MVDEAFLKQSYDAFARIEESFNRVLDESLGPTGPELLFQLAGGLGLPAGATCLDVGCGEGRHAIELARRFSLHVLGVDPVQRHIEVARSAVAEAARAGSPAAAKVVFELGRVSELPVATGSVDLVWCRDVLVHVDDLQAAFGEIRRVLNPAGKALVYHTVATDRLEPREAAWLLPAMGCVPENMQRNYFEASFSDAGLQLERRLALTSEWAEFGQERTGRGGRKLVHAARLLRDPERYIASYGRDNYEIALGDSLWQVYRFIGKLADSVYVLASQRSR